MTGAVGSGRWAVTALLACLAIGCGGAAPVEDPVGFDAVADPAPTPASPPAPLPSPTPTTDRTPTAAPVPTPDVSLPATAAPAVTPSAGPTPRNVANRDPYGPVLVWDGITIRLPSARTELVGLHQSNHDGARDLAAVTDPPVAIEVLPSRERGTGLRSAADIVVAPDSELRAPVTGTVVRAGTYTLYCDELDDFLVVEPDGHPGVEVKLLHIDGVQVVAGDRVVAAETVIAPRPTRLPFRSQVDDRSGPDDWPHVHLEVVDTAIPDRPNENSGSDDC